MQVNHSALTPISPIMPCKLITNQMLFHSEDGFHVTSPGSTLDMVVFHLQGGVSAVLVGAIMIALCSETMGFFVCLM